MLHPVLPSENQNYSSKNVFNMNTCICMDSTYPDLKVSRTVSIFGRERRRFQGITGRAWGSIEGAVGNIEGVRGNMRRAAGRNLV